MTISQTFASCTLLLLCALHDSSCQGGSVADQKGLLGSRNQRALSTPVTYAGVDRWTAVGTAIIYPGNGTWLTKTTLSRGAVWSDVDVSIAFNFTLSFKLTMDDVTFAGAGYGWAVVLQRDARGRSAVGNSVAPAFGLFVTYSDTYAQISQTAGLGTDMTTATKFFAPATAGSIWVSVSYDAGREIMYAQASTGYLETAVVPDLVQLLGLQTATLGIVVNAPLYGSNYASGTWSSALSNVRLTVGGEAYVPLNAPSPTARATSTRTPSPTPSMFWFNGPPSPPAAASLPSSSHAAAASSTSSARGWTVVEGDAGSGQSLAGTPTSPGSSMSKTEIIIASVCGGVAAIAAATAAAIMCNYQTLTRGRNKRAVRAPRYGATSFPPSLAGSGAGQPWAAAPRQGSVAWRVANEAAALAVLSGRQQGLPVGAVRSSATSTAPGPFEEPVPEALRQSSVLSDVDEPADPMDASQAPAAGHRRRSTLVAEDPAAQAPPDRTGQRQRWQQLAASTVIVVDGPTVEPALDDYSDDGSDGCSDTDAGGGHGGGDAGSTAAIRASPRPPGHRPPSRSPRLPPPIDDSPYDRHQEPLTPPPFDNCHRDGLETAAPISYDPVLVNLPSVEMAAIGMRCLQVQQPRLPPELRLHHRAMQIYSDL